MVAHKFSISDLSSVTSWKHLGRFSERQIGGYVTALLLLTGNAPTLLNANKDVPFRSNVIHNGYVPSADEAITFGNTVKCIIEEGLKSLREFTSESLEDVYSSLLPKSDESVSESENQVCGRTNILTALDVLNLPNIEQGDVRAGKVSDQFERILCEREPHRIHISPNEKDRENT